jgi:hypothetical protein
MSTLGAALASVVLMACGEDGAPRVPGKDGAPGNPGKDGTTTPGGDLSVNGITPGRVFLARSATLTISGFGTKWTKKKPPVVDFGCRWRELHRRGRATGRLLLNRSELQREPGVQFANQHFHVDHVAHEEKEDLPRACNLEHGSMQVVDWPSNLPDEAEQVSRLNQIAFEEPMQHVAELCAVPELPCARREAQLLGISLEQPERRFHQIGPFARGTRETAVGCELAHQVCHRVADLAGAP